MSGRLRVAEMLLSGVARAAAGLLLGLCAMQAAAQVTSPIPLAGLDPAPEDGVLPNGVNWTVNVGSWISPQGYATFPGSSPQIWTFDQGVSVRFGIAGLNLPGECVEVPGGTEDESIHANHGWDPGTRQVCRTPGAGPGDESIFTIAGPVTDLTLGIVGGAGNAGRGPTFIEVTTLASGAVSVPAVPVAGLVLLAGVFGLLGMRQRRRTTPAA